VTLYPEGVSGMIIDTTGVDVYIAATISGVSSWQLLGGHSSTGSGFLRIDGQNSMTADFNVGSNSVTNASSIHLINAANILNLAFNGSQWDYESNSDIRFDPTNNGTAAGVIQFSTVTQYDANIGEKIRFYNQAYRIDVTANNLDFITDSGMRWGNDTGYYGMTLNADTGVLSATFDGIFTGTVSSYLPLAGGTMTGAINMGGFNISNILNLIAPTNMILSLGNTGLFNVNENGNTFLQGNKTSGITFTSNNDSTFIFDDNGLSGTGLINIPTNAISSLQEDIEDNIARALVAGTSITIVYNDTSGEITINSLGGGGGGSGVTDHGALTGLSDDDHGQYLLISGTRAMTGNLDLDSNNLNNGGTITATSFSGSGAGLTSIATSAITNLREDTEDNIARSLVAGTSITINYDDGAGTVTINSLGGGGGGGTTDHGALSGLADDDHPQYLLASGARALTGNLDLDSNDIFDIGAGNSKFGIVLNVTNSITGNAILTQWNESDGGILGSFRETSNAGRFIVNNAGGSPVFDLDGSSQADFNLALDMNGNNIIAPHHITSTTGILIHVDSDNTDSVGNETFFVHDGSSNGAVFRTGYQYGTSINFAPGSIFGIYEDNVSQFIFEGDSKLTFDNLPTSDLIILDAGTIGATEQNWIEVTVSGFTGYIRVYATK